MFIFLRKKDRILFEELNTRLKDLVDKFQIEEKIDKTKDLEIQVFGEGIINQEALSEEERFIADKFGDEVDEVSKNKTFFEEDRISLNDLDNLEQPYY